PLRERAAAHDVRGFRTPRSVVAARRHAGGGPGSWGGGTEYFPMDPSDARSDDMARSCIRNGTGAPLSHGIAPTRRERGGADGGPEELVVLLVAQYLVASVR